jgi:uncharacterized protein YndB with AHSA1/START domain
MQQTNPVITVATTVNASVQKVWAYYTQPQHITQWNQASPDWHCPKAENDLRIGGKFSSTMAAKDGSFSFDFWGIYDDILENELMMYTMGDGRKATISFASNGDVTEVVTNFEPEQENSLELQQGGWQAILDSFKNYTETN